jgi:hypothetical protein
VGRPAQVATPAAKLSQRQASLTVAAAGLHQMAKYNELLQEQPSMPGLHSRAAGQQSSDYTLSIAGQGSKKVPVYECARGAAGIYGAPRLRGWKRGRLGLGTGAKTLQKQSVTRVNEKYRASPLYRVKSKDAPPTLANGRRPQ